MPIDSDLKVKLSIMLPELSEKQKRLLVATEALALGHGGIKMLSGITGMSKNTISRGIREIESGDTNCKRSRRGGGGRKKVEDKYPEIVQLIENIIEPASRGDPESPLQWTCKSVRNISSLLKKRVPHQNLWVKNGLFF